MIKTEFKDCTVITIAHRLNTIINYDKVIVLKDGNIFEMDSPINLINNQNSEFYNMLLTQGDDYVNRMKLLITSENENNNI